MKWRDATLGELVRRDAGLIQTGPFGSQLHQSDYLPEGVPVVMPKDIADGKISTETVARVSEETAGRLSRHRLKPRSIVLPRRGEVTKRAFIGPAQEGWLCGKGCLKIELTGEVLLPEFLYYFMEQGHVVQWLEQHAVGTTMLNLSAGIVADLPVHYPDTDQQRDIVDILSAYDDLIENNRRRISLLEESARLLYQEWFVRLRFPGHEHTPIVNGIPEGWQLGCVSDFYDTGSGGTPSRTNSDYFTGDIPWVKTQELKNTFVLATDERITEEALKRSAAKLFPDRTILIAMYGATVGQVGILTESATCNQACCAVVPRDPRANYIHAFLFFLENKADLAGLAMGAAQNNVNQQIIRSYPMLMPTRSLCEFFYDSLSSTLDQILNLLRQVERLKTARDLLLPRLMRGEIVVG